MIPTQASSLTITLGAFEAKTGLSELLARVEAGEEVTITKDGWPSRTISPPTVPRTCMWP